MGTSTRFCTSTTRVRTCSCTRRRETADAEAGDELAKRYEDLAAVLNVHLRREVTEVMPVVDRVLNEKELKAAAEHGTGQVDNKFPAAYLGLVLVTNPPADRKELFKEIPAPVRLATD